MTSPLHGSSAATEIPSSAGARSGEDAAVHPFIASVATELVDLTRRNPLLNFKPETSAVRLAVTPTSALAAFDAAADAPLDEIAAGGVEAKAHERIVARLAKRSALLEEEQGVHALYVATGILRWNDGKTRYVAPLMLLPAVMQGRGPARRISFLTESGHETNRALIELLRRHPFARVDPLEGRNSIDAEPSREKTEKAGTIDFDQVRSRVLAMLPDGADATIEESCFLGVFSYEKLAMVDDLLANAELIVANPLIAALAGDPAPLALREHGIESPAAADLEAAAASPERVYVKPADASQQSVLEAVARGSSVVVQGPPGTGKSTTIVNAIAQAVHDGKSVLFVAEKNVALEIVAQGLAEAGLGDIALLLRGKEDKRAFASDLTGLRDRLVEEASDETAFLPIEPIVDELNAYRDQLHAPLAETGQTPYVLYGRHAARVAKTPRARIAGAASIDAQKRRDLGEIVERLAENAAWLVSPATATWAALRSGVDVASVNERHGAMLEAYGGALEADAAARRACALLGDDVAGDADATSYETTLRRLDLVAAAPDVPTGWIDASPEGHSAALRRYEVERGSYDGNRRRLNDRYVEDAQDRELLSRLDALLEKYRSGLRRWIDRAYRRETGSLLRRAAPMPRYAELRADAEAMRDLAARGCAWANRDHEMRSLFGTLFTGAAADPDALQAALTWFEAYATLRAETRRPVAPAPLLGDAGALDRAEVRLVASALRRAVAAAEARRASLEAVLCDVPRDVEAWRAYLAPKIEMFDEATRYLAHRERRALARAAGLDPLIERLVGDAPPGAWRQAFEDVLDASLVDEAHRTRPALAGFERAAHERLRERFAEADASNVATASDRIRRAHVRRLRRAEDTTSYRDGYAVLRRESTRRRNRMPVRRLTAQAFAAVQAIKPCWMMSPLSVSRYLPPGEIFDLVIVDEASQILPSDAIAALSRGRQAVVVGDNKQLPPTNFFALAAEEESEEGEDGALVSDYESILDHCALVMQQRMLAWHYRSRHESLIAFSNERFYGGELITFPTPGGEGGLGLRLEKVDSPYDRGRTRMNRGEARRVAELAYEHASLHPEETLGVIAFSQAQQRAIEDAFAELAEARPELAAFFDASRPARERVFIKNLESVQGDERDAIILSVGYGRDAEGRLHYLFGPLDREGGGRRLNVAITRARRRMTVVSSIDDRDMSAEKCREGASSLLRDYLAYARTGDGARGVARATGRPAESPFEEDVYRVLVDAGYEVDRQVGASRYRLDLAIRRPGRDGEYVLAVECDGATYHGTQTARDRDRLRDGILRGYGWRIYRIWSRDWFRRRVEAIARLKVAVDAALAESSGA